MPVAHLGKRKMGATGFEPHYGQVWKVPSIPFQSSSSAVLPTVDDSERDSDQSKSIAPPLGLSDDDPKAGFIYIKSGWINEP